MTVLVDAGVRELVRVTTQRTANGTAIVMERAGLPALRLELTAGAALVLADELTRDCERRAA